MVYNKPRSYDYLLIGSHFEIVRFQRMDPKWPTVCDKSCVELLIEVLKGTAATQCRVIVQDRPEPAYSGA